MRVFCSYPFTGSDLEHITNRLRLVVDTLNESGHGAYCNRFDPDIEKIQGKGVIDKIFRSAFDNVKSRDALIVIIESPKVSLGTLMEVGVALDHDMPIYLFVKKGIDWVSYLPQLVTKTFEWGTQQNLVNELKNLQL